MPAYPFHRYAIIPAAGRSRRMGQPKLLLPWKDGTILDQVLAAWKASQVERIVIVLHPDDDSLANACRIAGVEVVLADPPPPDMRASLCAGVRYLQQHATIWPEDVLLMAPADLPDLSTQVINRLIEFHQPHAPCILVPMHQGDRGHPVLLPGSHAEKVLALREDEGLNALLAREQVREIDCSLAGVPQDIDTPEDYKRLRRT